MENENDPTKKGTGAVYMPLGMCLGMAIGTAIGVATDNLSVWMCCGMSIGMSLGIALDATGRKKKSDGSDANAQEE